MAEFTRDIGSVVDEKHEENSEKDITFGEKEETLFTKLNLPHNEESLDRQNITDETSSKPPVRKNIVIQLEPSLAEKLAKKRAVADELEDRLHNLRLKFDDTVLNLDQVKKELKRRESLLLQSIKKIEGFLREMFTLKREADNMYRGMKSTVQKTESELLIITKDNNIFSDKLDVARKVLILYQPAKVCLEKIVSGRFIYQCSPRYSSVKEFVEYYLVLKTLGNDLLEEGKRRLKAEERLTVERRQMSEMKRSQPLKVLAKEDLIYRLHSETKDIRLNNIELQHQVDSIISSKLKEELTWFNTVKWINKMYQSTCGVVPPQPEDSKGTVSLQLRKIQDFVIMGSQITKRLKERHGDMK